MSDTTMPVQPIPAGVISNADNDLKRIANFARGVLALDEAVARFGGLAAGIEETQARLDKLAIAESEAQGRREAAIRDHEAALAARTSEADEDVAAQHMLGARVVAGAQAEAERIVSDAKSVAAAVSQQLATVKATKEAETLDALAVLGELASQIEDAKAEHDELTAANGTLRAENERIAAVIEAARAQIGAR